jgi:hypothetical protein
MQSLAEAMLVDAREGHGFIPRDDTYLQDRHEVKQYDY